MSRAHTDLQVPPNYDSLLGKLIVWAEDRDQAIARMKRALSETVISGVPTTIDYHQLILDTKDFRDGNVDTGVAFAACCLLLAACPCRASLAAAPASTVSSADHWHACCRHAGFIPSHADELAKPPPSTKVCMMLLCSSHTGCGV
jgi:acetyl/propionyl-CoA carboxylase alpha subunit